MTSQVEPGSGVCEMHICSMIYFSVRLGSHWCKLDEGILHPIRMTGVCDQLLMESGGHGPHWQWVLCVFGSVSGTNLGKNSDTIRTWISEQGRTGPSAVAAAASVWTQPKDLFTWVISFSDFCWNRKHTSGLEPLTGPAKSLRPGLAVSGHSHMRQSSLIAHVNEACMIRSGLFLQDLRFHNEVLSDWIKYWAPVHTSETCYAIWRIKVTWQVTPYFWLWNHLKWVQLWLAPNLKRFLHYFWRFRVWLALMSVHEVALTGGFEIVLKQHDFKAAFGENGGWVLLVMEREVCLTKAKSLLVVLYSKIMQHNYYFITNLTKKLTKFCNDQITKTIRCFHQPLIETTIKE